MRTLGLVLLPVFLVACPDPGDTGPVTTADGCNATNETCGPGDCGGEGVNMLPGADCLSCHVRGGDEEADAWSVGGTVFTDLLGTEGLEGAIVRVTDSTGTTLELESSAVGNFYSERTLTPPLTAEVEVDGVVHAMSQEVTTGACNSCHACDGAAGGKIYP